MAENVLGLPIILGVVGFIGAISIFTSSFVEPNWILNTILSVLILLEGIYNFIKKNYIKGPIKIIAAVVLAVSIFFRIPFSINVIVGTALLVIAIYDVFPVIIGE